MSDPIQALADDSQASSFLWWQCRAEIMAVLRAAEWIGPLDMDPEDHKSHRKYHQLEQALAALKAAVVRETQT